MSATTSVLITGVTGFIGSALARHLVENTKFSIVVLDKLTYAGNKDSLPANSRCVIECVDICDEVAVAEVFLKHKPTVVMHLAAESHVDRSIDSPTQFVMTNVMGTCSLLEQSRIYYNALKDDQKNVREKQTISFEKEEKKKEKEKTHNLDRLTKLLNVHGF